MTLAIGIVRPRNKQTDRGFTLVEVGIVVAILALCAGVIVPAINNLSRADLRKAASSLSTTVRSCYDDAALRGQTYRLKMTVGSQDMTIESTEQTLRFDEKNNVLQQAAADNDPLEGLQLDALSPGAAPPPAVGGEGGVLGALSNVNKVSEKASETNFNKEGSFTLAGSVKVLDVWTESLGAPLTEGETYLYFFPNGFTQEALIHLEDGEKRTFTVKVSGLTGKSTIEGGYIEAPK